MSIQFFKKKVLPLALTASMMLSATPVLAASNDLDGHWAKNVITEWQDKGLIKGYSDGTFKPNNSITRAEFIVLMNNAQGYAENAAISFSDVAESDWYYGAVAKAVKAGYTKGYEDGTFQPNKTITRAEAAVMIANAAGLSANESGASFTDVASIPAWANGSIGAAAAAGYLSGYPDGSFGAAKSITRAEAVSSLNRMLGDAKEDVVIKEADTTLENETISGDLIIDEAVGDGEVYLNNVEVDGDLIVKGGGENSVYLNGSTIGGRIIMQKNGVHLHITGSCNIPSINMTLPGRISFGDDFDGSVRSIDIPENALFGSYIIESNNNETIPVKTLTFDAKIMLVLNANVSDVNAGENAENSSVTVGEETTVDSMDIQSEIEVDGDGKVNEIEANESGSDISDNLDVGTITNTPKKDTDSEDNSSENKTTGTSSTKNNSSNKRPSGSNKNDTTKGKTVNTLAVGYLRGFAIQAIFDQKVPAKGTKVNVVAIYDSGKKVTLNAPSAAGVDGGDFYLALDDFEDYYNSDYTYNAKNWNMLGIYLQDFFGTSAASADISGFEITVTAPGYSFSTIKVNENDTLTESINMIDSFIKGSKLTTEDHLGFQVYGAEDIDTNEISVAISPADSGLTVGVIEKDTVDYNDSTYIRINYEGAPTKAGTYFATITIPASAITEADGYTAKDVTAYCAIKVLDPQITSAAIYKAGTTTPITQADLGSSQSVDILLSGKNLSFGSISVKLANAEGEGSNVLTPSSEYYDDLTKELFDWCPLKKRTAGTYYVWYSFDKENWTKLDSPTLTIVDPSAAAPTAPATLTITGTNTTVDGVTNSEATFTVSGDTDGKLAASDLNITVKKSDGTALSSSDYSVTVSGNTITVTFTNVNAADGNYTVNVAIASASASKYTIDSSITTDFTVTNNAKAPTSGPVIDTGEGESN